VRSSSRWTAGGPIGDGDVVPHPLRGREGQQRPQAGEIHGRDALEVHQHCARVPDRAERQLALQQRCGGQVDLAAERHDHLVVAADADHIEVRQQEGFFACTHRLSS
jgi:hypothetical protein